MDDRMLDDCVVDDSTPDDCALDDSVLDVGMPDDWALGDCAWDVCGPDEHALPGAGAPYRDYQATGVAVATAATGGGRYILQQIVGSALYRSAFAVCVLLLSLIEISPVRAQHRGVGREIAEEEIVSDEEFRQSLSDEESAAAQRMIADLGSPVYEKREAATKRLIEIGLPTLTLLRTAYHNAHDLETRLRIEEVVRKSYLNHHVYLRNGFLGIRQDGRPVTADDDPRIAEGKIGVRIAGILPGTAAEEVDLQEHDVIISLDGEPVPAGVAEPMLAFGESLRIRGPGTPVRLLILRGPQTAEVHVVLRPRPKAYYGRGTPVGRMLLDAEAQFDSWWAQHFRQRDSGH